MVTELSGVQFWSEIILVISNQTRVEITRMISEKIALHSIQLPLSRAIYASCHFLGSLDAAIMNNCDDPGRGVLPIMAYTRRFDSARKGNLPSLWGCLILLSTLRSNQGLVSPCDQALHFDWRASGSRVSSRADSPQKRELARRLGLESSTLLYQKSRYAHCEKSCIYGKTV